MVTHTSIHSDFYIIYDILNEFTYNILKHANVLPARACDSPRLALKKKN